MQEISSSNDFNLVYFLINIIIMLISGYLVLLVRSLRKEYGLKIENSEKLSEQRCKSYEENQRDLKEKLEDLLVRSRVLGELDIRLKAGSENFKDIKERLGFLEAKVFGKKK